MVAVVGDSLIGAVLGAAAAVYALDVPSRGSLPRRFPARRMWRASRGNRLVIVAGAAGSAASALLVSGRGDLGCVRWAYIASIALGAGLAIVDCRVRRLPHVVTGLMFVICGFSFAVDGLVHGRGDGVIRSVVAAGGILAGGIVLAMVFVGGLGLGDVVLASWVGFSLGWIGWDTAELGLLIGLMAQSALFGGLALVPGLHQRPRDLPMGPALLLGWLVALAWNR